MLLGYFNAHPRMGVLTRTLGKSFQEMAHFGLLFLFLFAFLTFMAAGRCHAGGRKLPDHIKGRTLPY